MCYNAIAVRSLGLERSEDQTENLFSAFLWHTVPAGSGTLLMQTVPSSSAGVCHGCYPPNHLLLLILHFLQVSMFFKRLCYFVLSASWPIFALPWSCYAEVLLN